MFIGQILYGYCEGYFGRDSYEPKRIEGFGVDWVVAREIGNGQIFIATFESSSEMLSKIGLWSVEEKL